MENSEQKRKDIKNFVREQKTVGATFMHNAGYVSMVLSPAAARDKDKVDKLAITLTFEEWRQVLDYIEETPHVRGWNSLRDETVLFLRGAIKTIPSTIQESVGTSIDTTIETPRSDV